jgi:hypothetical protein
LPEVRLQQGRPAPHAADFARRFARTERASPDARDLRRDIAEDLAAQPVRTTPRRQPGAEDAAPSRDGRRAEAAATSARRR